MNPIKKAAEIVGSQANLARILGVTKAAVNQWIATQPPVDRCIAIEEATCGGVRCEEMRPDQNWKYLRATDCPVIPQHQEAA